MTSTDNDNKNNIMNPSIDQQTTSTSNVPIYDASSAHQHSHTCNDPSHHHHHHHPSFFDQADEHAAATDAAAARNRMLMKRKAKKNQKQDITRAEFIPGHQGDKNIDDLLNFINGPSTASNSTNSQKSKKK